MIGSSFLNQHIQKGTLPWNGVSHRLTEAPEGPTGTSPCYSGFKNSLPTSLSQGFFCRNFGFFFWRSFWELLVTLIHSHRVDYLLTLTSGVITIAESVASYVVGGYLLVSLGVISAFNPQLVRGV